MIRTPSKVVMVSSSPGRAEKLPAPMLTTLLRGKGGSRSRGRSSASISRSSPMFTARRRGASVDIQEEKEPSSPKVTCIGQVRISKRKSSASGSSSSPLRSKPEQQKCVPRGCRCFRRGFFCNPFSKGFGVKFKPSSASASPYRHHDPRGWRKWFLLPRSGCYRQRNPPRQRQQHQQWQKEETPRMPTGALAAVAGSDDEGEHGEHGEVEEDDDEEETKVFVPTTPPKNALLLMRCRSAPHRAAYVPDRPFWSGASPCGAESDSAAAAPGGMEPSRGGENRGEAEPINDYSTLSTYEARARGINDGGAGESGEGEDDDGEAAAVGRSPSFSSRRLILTRCKSEPARTAAKLAAPDASYCFWNSGSNQSNKPRSKNSSSSSNNNNNKRWLTLLGEARPIPPP